MLQFIYRQQSANNEFVERKGLAVPVGAVDSGKFAMMVEYMFHNKMKLVLKGDSITAETQRVIVRSNWMQLTHELGPGSSADTRLKSAIARKK